VVSAEGCQAYLGHQQHCSMSFHVITIQPSLLTAADTSSLAGKHWLGVDKALGYSGFHPDLNA
jgi:hypothetical protein